nr:uncharacterized protein LOC118682728 [Bactrocera oleae]
MYGQWSPLYSRTSILFSRKLSQERIVSSHIKKTDYYYRLRYPGSTIGVPDIKTELEIKDTRLSCKMAGQVLAAWSRLIKVSYGKPGKEFDDLRYSSIPSDRGAKEIVAVTFLQYFFFTSK